jgi:hypothetical protein
VVQTPHGDREPRRYQHEKKTARQPRIYWLPDGDTFQGVCVGGIGFLMSGSLAPMDGSESRGHLPGQKGNTFTRITDGQKILHFSRLWLSVYACGRVCMCVAECGIPTEPHKSGQLDLRVTRKKYQGSPWYFFLHGCVLSESLVHLPHLYYLWKIKS